MTLKTTKLRNAIVFALAVSGGALAAVGSASAQDAPPVSSPDATSLDTVTVTGTRIRSQTMTASSPVAEISKEEFKYSGATTVEDLVNQYPQLSLDFDNFLNNGSQGYATVDLRGMGANRTLALVNGRRIPKGVGETADISIVPAALVQRVDVLTGGASAVYGSDAIAGVVNFILDDQFEGVNVNVGYSAYQHKNDDRYIQGLMDQSGFDYPTGGSGFDGIAKNIDVAIGGAFGDGGHAVAWATWRKNDALLQGQRDYSSCALNANGTACGGSPTADPGNFYVLAPGFVGYALPSASGWFEPDGPNIYNFAPVNYYQRPDTRFTAGASVKYEVNEYFKPYVETMFVNRRSSTQIAPSGAFFTDIEVNCDTDVIGTMCADLGITTPDDFTIYVAKRNVEGGPRITDTESTNYSITTGATGNLFDSGWIWDASLQYARTTVADSNSNDFITTRVRDALLGCPPGAFDGCLTYDVWNDAVTPEQAQSLQGIGIVNYNTDMQVFNVFATGDLGFALPWASDREVSGVVGYEKRKERFNRIADANMAIGNFTGLGGPTTNLSGGYDITEAFLEGNVPLVAGAGSLDSLDLQLGYRYTDYSTSGNVNTWKVGLGAAFFDNTFRLRAGFNRAIRGANIGELFSSQQIALWAGEDKCAGANPVFTQAQCARTGVTAAQYGNVPANAAGQYNQFIGGNPSLDPETANTFTVGFAATPIENLDLSVDYYDIKLENVIGTLGASTIIDLCANGQDAMCDLIRRNPASGDLFRGSDPNSSGLVVNTNGNFGSRRYRGIDLTAGYAKEVGIGRLSASYVGSHILERSFQPVPGDSSADYACEGLVNNLCATPEWRHITSVRYGFDRYTVNLRWRYIGEMDYKSVDGTALTTDYFLGGKGKQSAFNYFDLSGSAQIGDNITWTAGVNNIADKAPPMVGSALAPPNGNSLSGYDQAGRYIFTSVAFTF